MTPHVASFPVIYSSTRTLGEIPRAVTKASSRSLNLSTIVAPTEEPAVAGFTTHGGEILLKICLSASSNSFAEVGSTVTPLAS